MMKKYFLNLLLVLGLVGMSACDFDDLLDSPNDVTADSADANFLLNRIQTDFALWFNDNSFRGQTVTRMLNQDSDTYEIAHQAVDQNATWQDAYSKILIDINTVKGLAEDRGFRRHLGIAKVLEAYTWMQLVDIFGNVPFSEAFDASNFNPKIDQGSDVYKAAFNLLESAQADFSATSVGSPNDFFYGGNATKWTRLINTLKLRYYLNLRLTDAAGSKSAIDALIAEDNFIKAGDDFVFSYGRSATDPDSRHRNFAVQFPNGGGDYQSTFFMWHLTEEKGLDDPRARYYFFRQVGENPTNISEARCLGEFVPAHYPTGMPWCMPGMRGYWGRDHLDPQGIPPDGNKRTLHGLYPAGASFDTGTPVSLTASNTGNGGAGIDPIMLTAFVDFMLAESALTLGTAGDPKALMMSGITKHINYVRSWSLGTAEAGKINAAGSQANFDAARDAYLAAVDADYDAETDKLNIIAREYWISLFGNGNEAYNLYRRTGRPNNMQPGQIPAFGKFPRTFFYPDNHVNRNANAQQKPNHDVTVFWDNNPAGFID